MSDKLMSWLVIAFVLLLSLSIVTHGCWMDAVRFAG